MNKTNIGQRERLTQNRIVALFHDKTKLDYAYLGNLEERADNSNIDSNLLRSFLREQNYDEKIIDRALYLFVREAGDTSKSIYDRNRNVYELLRYGVKVKPEISASTQTVWLIDWKHPDRNHFAIGEEVTINASRAGANTKRPDIVIYVNGIALGVLELNAQLFPLRKGIRQNLDNQKKIFIEHFFSTIQLVMAGNDTEGLRYGTLQTPEKYYLTWKEESSVENTL